MAKQKTLAFSAELLDQLLDGQDPTTVLRSDGLMGELKKALAERMLNAEMDIHLDAEVEQATGNHRNGSSQKTVLGDDGEWVLSIPRDRHGRFDPALIRKYQRRFPGFDEKIIALYARGLSTRDIQAHVGELYGVAISPDWVSAVTDSVIAEVRAWQSRPLESSYALVFFDALRVKIRDEGLVRNKAVYLAIGVRCSGHKEVLGLWIEQTEGAKFWLRVMNELKARGMGDNLDRRGRWSQRLPRGDYRCVPGYPRPDLYCPPDPLFDPTGLLEGSQAVDPGTQADLPSRQCGNGRAGPECVRERSLG